MSLLQLSFLLWATQGVKSIRGKSYATIRTAPCGGARHPFQTYLLVRQVEAERLAMDSLRFSSNGLVALVKIPLDIYGKTGASESDLDGIASLPREIQGVVLGVTLKEKEGKVKVSLRANPPADASVLCARFGGGGHQGAAGCSLEGATLEQAQAALEQACQAYLQELNLL